MSLPPQTLGLPPGIKVIFPPCPAGNLAWSPASSDLLIKFWLPAHELMFPLHVWYWNMSPNPAGETSFIYRAWLSHSLNETTISERHSQILREHTQRQEVVLLYGHCDNTSVKVRVPGC